MGDLDKARQLFADAGLAFPKIPEGLAAKLKEREPWLFSTRRIKVSPYLLEHYVDEPMASQLKDYVLLSHSGHSTNSYAIQ